MTTTKTTRATTTHPHSSSSCSSSPHTTNRLFISTSLKYRERYTHSLSSYFSSSSSSSFASFEDSILYIPDASFLRKYLRLLEELLHQNDLTQKEESGAAVVLLLESVAEYLDYRSSSPFLPSSSSSSSSSEEEEEMTTEAANKNERSRVFKLLRSHPSILYSFPDLSLLTNQEEEEEEDEWRFYMHQSIQTKCIWGLHRSQRLLSAYSKKVLILSDEEQQQQQQQEEEEKDKILNCTSFLHSLNLSKKSLQNYLELQKVCQEEYQTRQSNNSSSSSSGTTTTTTLHAPYYSKQYLLQGLKSKTLYSGTFQVSNENYKEAFVNSGNNKYFIKWEYYNRAIHGDEVVIEVLPEEEWDVPLGRRKLIHVVEDDDEEEEEEEKKEKKFVSKKEGALPTAKVVGLHPLSNSKRRTQYIATVPSTSSSSDSLLVVPMDIRIPKIRLRTKLPKSVYGKQRIVVEIDFWDRESLYPNGHFVKVLGEVGDLETEIACLLLEHSVHLSPFSTNALSCLPSIPSSQEETWNIPLKEIHKRRDLRKSCSIFSVDPPGCQDIDDAMHAKPLPNGDVEVGVHIADVSHFVQHRSALDNEAMKRGTTFYLVDRRFDMLPSILSSDLCSLHGQVDRLAVSVIWTLSSDLKTVKSTWFGRTVIHNVAAMTYQQAHNILHSKPPDDLTAPLPPPLTAGSPVNTKLIPSLKKDLTILTKLARILRKNREEIGGAVDLSSGNDRGSELKFTLDANGLPTKVMPKTEMEIHHTIAELMIMANGYVASKIYESFPSSSLLRIHRNVEQGKFEDLESAFKAGGVSFDGRSNMALAESLKQAKASGKDGGVIDSLFQSLATRAMSEAQYICTGSREASVGLSHYGLGIEKYTHFTSPIRRYADVVVHRLLLAAVADKDEVGQTKSSLDVGVDRNVLESIPDSAAMSVLAGDGLDGNNKEKEETDELEGDDLLDFLLEDTSQLNLGEDDGNDDLSRMDKCKKAHEVKEIDDTSKRARADLYSTTEVIQICEGINHQNRISKLCSMACQRLFLSLYFQGHTDIAPAVIIGLRTNGLLVYVPKYDMKGPVFLSDKDGNVQVQPSILRLPPNDGLPPTSGFAIVDGCKKFPNGKCNIVNADDEAKKYLQLTVPSGSSSVHCDFRILDVVEIQLSCDTSDTIARIPPTRLHLLSKGKKPKIGAANETKITTKLVKQRQDLDAMDSKMISTAHEANNVESASNVYHIISSIEIRPNLDDTPFRFSRRQQNCTKMAQKQERVQTIPGRFVFGAFRNPDTHKASQEAAANAAAEAAAERRNIVVQSQAVSREYDTVRRIERDVTSRMQRLAAEKRHTRRAKAGK